ncbi:hypothetical protein CDD82_6336 [Ophiocordyceps australis]|uniref:Lectin n=1 Tax=Ophiocordyceps australis TaxID=1399860 RepID=A0A2C5Y118_9HYPO|nr:hypothetical protein CDD82_6336 [Ophiocordyceps australis]
MSYTITTRVYQTNHNAFFAPVEFCVFNNGSWTSCSYEPVLTMGGSGTSGCIRFVADTGENFIVAIGVHNYKPWGDIVTKLDTNQTGVKLLPEYYETEWGGTQKKERVDVRWKTLSSYEVTRDGRKYAFKFTVTEGKNLKVNIIIS